jgi:PTH1 family peptidyl-tRNA hydrolase
MSSQPIRLIVGLGNPGPQYETTRHNAGFWFVDAVARRQHLQFRAESRFQGLLARLTLNGTDLRLLKPATFMNRSGQSVAAVVRYFDIPPQSVLVAHDELDLPEGTVRLKNGGGHAGHNGLRDIVNVLGSRDFWRLRIGIDRPADRGQVVNYVLSRASRAGERLVLDALAAAEHSLPDIVAGNFQKAMTRMHGAR